MPKYNLGCGANKLAGCINVDAESSINPDLLADITKPLPIESEIADDVYLFHTIEHIAKKLHKSVYSEVHRILKPDGRFVLTYPEFSAVAKNWLENKRGMKKFWEHTIYGLQRYPTDFHVALMDTPEVIDFLKEVGFYKITFRTEPTQDFNTVITCHKGTPPLKYEDVLRGELFGN